MGRIAFSVEVDEDEHERTARAMAYELHISPKHAYEICRAIKGMRVEDAERYLEAVIAKEVPLPFKKHKKKVPHRRNLEKWYAGRYPVKAASAILRLLRDAKANASYKGLDADEMRIWHIATKKGRTIRGFIPRAFGRATPFDTQTVTVEVILKAEEEKEVRESGG
ncbi:MAG: 50S ribosomal protein L22 [Canidatus Methanoxibalbensis ujae]|nr:50S ribosomal protein L22 [Candidatus Methanoxibalbensis ujae]